MRLRIKTGLIFCLLATGCSDYQTGYQEGYKHGYQEAKHNRWIVFGRSNYLRGYDAGQAEKFQEEWVTEDPLELGDSPLRCREIKIEADALMFLPEEYRRISSDTYRTN